MTVEERLNKFCLMAEQFCADVMAGKIERPTPQERWAILPRIYIANVKIWWRKFRSRRVGRKK